MSEKSKGDKNKNFNKKAKPTKSGAFGSIKKFMGISGSKSGKTEAHSKKAAPLVKPKSKAPVLAKPAKPAAPVQGKKHDKHDKFAKHAKPPKKGAKPVEQKPALKSGGKAAQGGGKGLLSKSALELRLSGGSRTSSSASTICREIACELMSTTGGYCRMHYIKNWKKIKRKEMILKERKLNHYIEELVSKYPDKYIEAIRQDLASEKDFAKVIADLEIEEGLDDFDAVDTESAEGLIDNLKRDFEDEGDVF